MLNFQESLSNSLREEFFPFVNESSIQEKLLTNGYKIESVRKRKGTIVFKAKNSCEIIDTLLFGINQTTKEMTVIGIISPHGAKVFLFRTMVYSNIRTETISPFLDALRKISFNKGMLSKLSSFLQNKNPETWNSDENYFYSNEYKNDPLLFSLLSKFRSLSYWATNRQNNYFESSLLDMLENIHSPKLQFISELSPVKKRKLKRDVVEMIAFSFMRGVEFPGKRLFQIINQGKSYLGLNIYPFLLDKVKYSEVQFNEFFDEIKLTLVEDIQNYLIANIQTLHMTLNGNAFINGDKVKTLHRKIFDKKPNYVTLNEKYLEIKRAGLALHVLMKYLETKPELIASLFENGNSLLKDIVFEIPVWKNLSKDFIEEMKKQLIVDMNHYIDLIDIYQIREAYALRGITLNTAPEEIPF